MMDHADYKTMPKSSPDGEGRINPTVREEVFGASPMNTDRSTPIRVHGESERRGFSGDVDEILDYQDFRKTISDKYFENSLTAELPTASKTLVNNPQLLQNSEYVNRKVEAKRAALREEGLSDAEIDRKMAYDRAELRRLREESESEQEIWDLQKLDLPEYDDLFNHKFETVQKKMAVLEAHLEAILKAKDSNWKARAARINKALERLKTEPEYKLSYDPVTQKTTVNGKPLVSIEDAILELVDTKPEGWEAQVIELREMLRKAQAMMPKEEVFDIELLTQRAKDGGRLSATEHRAVVEHLLKQRLVSPEQMEQMAIRGNINPVEPPPPPPVLDFTTGDLEIPERFIIKDLDGFKFDPETKFDGLKLPYESCLFVLGTELKAVVLATQEEDDVISLKLLSEQKNDIPWHATATLYARLKGDRAETKWIKTARSLDKRLAMVSSVLAFIAGEQLNELQIETVITAPEGRDIPPPKPGFCYNVVHLTQGKKGKRKDWQGGTHASPREHKRRGYWWPGKNGPIWIKATIVNKGVLGRVDKEYHVTKVEEAS